MFNFSGLRIHLLPIGTAFAWTFAYPHLARRLLIYALNMDRLLKEARFKVEAITPISQEERGELLVEIDNLKQQLAEKDKKHFEELKRAEETARAIQRKTVEPVTKPDFEQAYTALSLPASTKQRAYTTARMKLEKILNAVEVALVGMSSARPRKIFAPNKVIFEKNILTADEVEVLEKIPPLYWDGERIGCEEISEYALEVFSKKFEGKKVSLREYANTDEIREANDVISKFTALCKRAIEGLKPLESE